MAADWARATRGCHSVSRPQSSRNRARCFPMASPPTLDRPVLDAKSLIFMADPARFELTTSAFGEQRPDVLGRRVQQQVTAPLPTWSRPIGQRPSLPPRLHPAWYQWEQLGLGRRAAFASTVSSEPSARRHCGSKLHHPKIQRMATQDQRRKATIGAIVEAARTHFGRDGYVATSIDDIASRASVAKGAVYHHFSSKAQVFAAVIGGRCHLASRFVR